MPAAAWRILALLSILGLSLSYVGTEKTGSKSYVVRYMLTNGHLTSLSIASCELEVVDQGGLIVARGHISAPVRLGTGERGMLQIELSLLEPLPVLVKRHGKDVKMVFRGYVIYDTGWLSWFLGGGRLEFEEKISMGAILDYLGLYSIETDLLDGSVG